VHSLYVNVFDSFVESKALVGVKCRKCQLVFRMPHFEDIRTCKKGIYMDICQDNDDRDVLVQHVLNQLLMF